MRVGVSNHAVDRYVERVVPALGSDAARKQLERLVRMAGEPSCEKPAWHIKAEPCSEYLHISDGIAATVKERIVTSILTRASEAPEAREVKKRRKAKKRDERSHRVRVHSRGGRSELRSRKAATWE